MKIKKAFSACVILSMLLSLAPTAVLAEEDNAPNPVIEETAEMGETDLEESAETEETAIEKSGETNPEESEERQEEEQTEQKEETAAEPSLFSADENGIALFAQSEADLPFTVGEIEGLQGSEKIEGKGLLNKEVYVRVICSKVTDEIKNKLYRSAKSIKVDGAEIGTNWGGDDDKTTEWLSGSFTPTKNSHTLEFSLTYDGVTVTRTGTLEFEKCAHPKDGFYYYENKKHCGKCSATIVAEIGAEHYYSSLSDAIEGAQALGADSTIKLTDDCNVDETIEVNSGTVTLDVNGQSITYADGKVISVGGNGNLTVINNVTASRNTGKFQLNGKNAVITLTEGSKYAELSVADAVDKTVADLLPEGYGYKYQTEGWADEETLAGKTVNDVVIAEVPFTIGEIKTDPEVRLVGRQTIAYVDVNCPKEIQIEDTWCINDGEPAWHRYTYFGNDRITWLNYYPEKEPHTLKLQATYDGYTVTRTLQVTPVTCEHKKIDIASGKCTDCGNQLTVSRVGSLSNVTLEEFCATAEAVLNSGTLPSAVTVSFAEGGTIDIPCSWTLEEGDTYQKNPNAVNRFRWTLGTNGFNMNGNAASGVIEVTNRDAVQLSAPVVNVTDGNKEYDKTTAFKGTAVVAAVSGILAEDTDVSVVVDTAAYTDVAVGAMLKLTFRVEGENAWKYTAPAELIKDDCRIQQKALTDVDCSQVIVSKAYHAEDSTAVIEGTIAFGGKIEGDDVSVKVQHAVFADANASAGEGRAVTLTLALDGADKDSYTLNQTEVSANVGRISKTDWSGTAEKTINTYKGYSAEQKGTVGADAFFDGAVPDGAEIKSVTPNGGTMMKSVLLSDGKISYESNADITAAENETYTVVIGTTNYHDITARLIFSPVEKTEVTITGITADASCEYDGTAKTGYTGTAEFTPEWNGTLETVYYLQDGITKTTPANSGSSAEGAAPVFAGNYKAVLSIPKSDMTHKGEVSVEFRISKKSVAPPLKDSTVFVYNGNSHTYNILPTEAYGVNGAVEKNAGAYKVEVFLRDTANMQWQDGSSAPLSYDFVIEKAKAKLKAADKTMFVRRDAPDLSNPVEGKDYTVTGLIGTDKLDGTVTLSYSGLDVNKVGTADIIATAENTNSNYDVICEKGTLTIRKRPSSSGGSSADTGKADTPADGNGTAVTNPSDKDDDAGKDKPQEKTVIRMRIGNKNVTVDENMITNDAAPLLRNDRTMVPIRIITETLGGKVDWNGMVKEVTLTIDGKEIKMTIGRTLEKYNVAPVIIDGRTYVPVRFVADELGAVVSWDDATKTVTIIK